MSKKVVLVLGMHKSGTSLVAQILHRSGVAMGDPAETDGNYDHGVFCERTAVRELNQEILGFGDPAHLSRPPCPLLLREETRERMRRLIRGLDATGSSWGFKDPRTCLTYGLWEPELPLHDLVLVYRSPGEVWSHFRRRESGPFEIGQVAQAWCEYNEALLAIAARRPDALVLSFERLVTGAGELARIGRFLGAPVFDHRSPEKYRSRGGASAALSAVSAWRTIVGRSSPYRLFGRLEALHAAQCGHAPSDAVDQSLTRIASGRGRPSPSV
jgi:hypothetical protein